MESQKGFSLVESLLVLAVIALLALGGWRVASTHHKTVVGQSKSSMLTKDGPFTKGLGLIASFYEGNTPAQTALSPELYTKILADEKSNTIDHDEITCGQGLTAPDIAGYAKIRVALESNTTTSSLFAEVDDLTEQSGESPYYSVGPTVTVDVASLKITAIKCQ